jgi:L-alanine-DL-glutamate epimerase-like enolase superfamily enzyme
LIDMGAIDMIHPDLASAGGLIETKKIGDYAMEHGVAMAMHFAGTPISFMANVHCAAATENFIALEHHSLDVPWWEDLARTATGQPLVDKGFAIVPDAPGLGRRSQRGSRESSTCGPTPATSDPHRSGTRSEATIALELSHRQTEKRRRLK